MGFFGFPNGFDQLWVSIFGLAHYVFQTEAGWLPGWAGLGSGAAGWAGLQGWPADCGC